MRECGGEGEENKDFSVKGAEFIVMGERPRITAIG